MLIATVASVVLLKSRGLRKDYTLEAFVADDSEDYATFRRLMDDFLSNELAIIAVQGEADGFEDTLDVVSELQTQVETLEAVERVTSLADVPTMIRSVLGEQIMRHPLFVDNVVSRDGRTAAMVLQMRGEGASGEIRKATVERLKELVASAKTRHPGKRIVLTGPYVTLIDMYDYVDHDLRVFSLAAFSLLLITLGIVFRRIAPVVFALTVSMAATLCTLGLAIALDLPMTLITQMIVILVMVLSVANCVHLGVADDDIFAAAPFYDWPERAKRVLRRMAAPCAAAMLTTATGFGSVAISGITPVRMFGILMVVGLAM